MASIHPFPEAIGRCSECNATVFLGTPFCWCLVIPRKERQYLCGECSECYRIAQRFHNHAHLSSSSVFDQDGRAVILQSDRG